MSAVALTELDRRAVGWMRYAVCRLEGVSSDVFFQEQGGDPMSKTTGYARELCGRCVVRPECLDYALDLHIVDGIWGGMTVRERRAERARRNGA